MFVTKRNGTQEEVLFDKITEIINKFLVCLDQQTPFWENVDQTNLFIYIYIYIL